MWRARRSSVRQRVQLPPAGPGLGPRVEASPAQQHARCQTRLMLPLWSLLMAQAQSAAQSPLSLSSSGHWPCNQWLRSWGIRCAWRCPLRTSRGWAGWVTSRCHPHQSRWQRRWRHPQSPAGIRLQPAGHGRGAWTHAGPGCARQHPQMQIKWQHPQTHPTALHPQTHACTLKSYPDAAPTPPPPAALHSNPPTSSCSCTAASAASAAALVRFWATLPVLMVRQRLAR